MQDDKKIFYILITLFFLMTIIVIISVIIRGIHWNEITIPSSGWITFFIWAVLAIPLIISYLKLFIQKFIIKIRTYFGFSQTYEQWREGKKYFGIKHQSEILEYYSQLRNEIGDEQIVKRIIEFNFVYGDKLEHVLSSLEIPDFMIHHRFWQFYDKHYLYYFPYYLSKNPISFFSIKYKYEFVFTNQTLKQLKIDGKEQL